MKTSNANNNSTFHRGCGIYVFSDDDSRVLLMQRGPLARHEHYHWEAPGGEVEVGEDYAAAAVREFREELGIDVVLGDIITADKSITDVHGSQWETRIYRGKVTDTPIIQEPGKCVGFGWFTREEVRLMHQAGMFANYIVRDFQDIGWL